jgi:hypothetical protein
VITVWTWVIIYACAAACLFTGYTVGWWLHEDKTARQMEACRDALRKRHQPTRPLTLTQRYMAYERPFLEWESPPTRSYREWRYPERVP